MPHQERNADNDIWREFDRQRAARADSWGVQNEAEIATQIAAGTLGGTHFGNTHSRLTDVASGRTVDFYSRTGTVMRDGRRLSGIGLAFALRQIRG